MDASSVYEIVLPLHDNSGNSLAQAHGDLKGYMLALAGGYTERPAGNGAWMDDKGRMYHDVMVPYRVLCSAGYFRAILSKAFSLFPDQLAIYTSHVGEATIHNNPCHNGGTNAKLETC